MFLFLIALLVVLSIGYQARNAIERRARRLGVVAIILGFAAQNFLSSLVAGMSLQIERPYKVGDWLKVGEIYGEVMEIHWGATKLRTNDAITLHIPNNEIDQADDRESQLPDATAFQAIEHRRGIRHSA